MSDPEKAVEIGRQARQLADSDFFNQVITHVVARVVREMATLQVGDPKVVNLHAEMVACNKFKEVLQSLANDGIMAEKKVRQG